MLTSRQKLAVVSLAVLFAMIPFIFVRGLAIGHFKVVDDLDATAFFLSLGLLPGLVGIVFHIVSAGPSRRRNRDLIDQYYAYRNSRAAARPHERGVPPAEDASTGPLGAIAASLFLTGIFLLIAIFAGFEATTQSGSVANGVQGMMYAGLGAYVAVLYYMVARLYANALSARFIVTSAIRTASAVALGWVFGILGVTAFVDPAATTSSGTVLASCAVIFLVGLFHNMAIDSLRRRAMKLFGTAAFDSEAVSLTAVEGIDDTTAELLNEHGVSSIQHLATTEPGELGERTLLPLDRIFDWIDQALLIRSLQRNITAARGLAIRGAIDLALVQDEPDGAKLFASLAEKSAMPVAAIERIARDLRGDYMVALIYELQQGRPFPTSSTASTSANTSTLVEASAPVAIPIKASGPSIALQP